MGNSSVKTALVTGATGFVGSHLARRLVEEEWDVHIVTRPQSSLTLLGKSASEVVQHLYDGTTESIVDIVGTTQPNIVFHLASLFLARHTSADVNPLIESNVLLGTQLLEAMRIHNVKRFVNTGTSWQHFENASYSPVCLYAATKQAFDAMIAYYVEISHLCVITLSLFDTYGTDDVRPKLLNLLNRTLLRCEPLEMSPGEQLIDLVHVDDVVEAYVLAAKRLDDPWCERWQEYAVTSGNPIQLRELVALYEEISGKSLPITWGGRPYREREVMIPWNTGRRLPGWVPNISLLDGLRQILTEFLNDHNVNRTL